MNNHINPITGKQPCTTPYKAGGRTTVRRWKAMMEEGQLFCYLLLLLAVTGAAPVNAQPQPIAFGGAAGIYVFNPFDPCTPQKPNAKGAVKYKLERRETGGQWQAVGTYSGPASESELTKAYHRYYKYVLGPEFTNPNAVLKLWQQYNRTPRWDSLGQFFFDRAAALAVCYQFIDTTARTGTSYEYQVSQLDKNDRVLNSYTSTAVQYPNKAAFKNTAKLSAAEGTQLQAYVVWKQECATRPVFYRVYRKDGPMSDFQLLQNAANITRVGNTSTYQLELRDRSTGANQMYLYYIVPVDGLGNTGEPSDTAMVKTYETKDILTPQYFSAEKLPGKRGVLLTWKLHHYQSVAGIEVFRCDNYDGNYTKIGTADETDTSYTDLTATPSKVYYYYLQIIDRFSKSSLRTARTSALYQDTRAPRAPRYVTAAMQGDKVKVSWVTADPEIAGYYVYRSVGHDTVYTLISDFITAKDSITTFIDATNDFKSPYGYSYTVTQENISHVSSKYAYPAYLPAQIKQADAPVPMHIEAGPGKKGVMVFWDDMQNYSGVVGYKLQRRTLGKGDYLPVSDGMLSVSRNFYADTTVRQGNVYEYAVQTVMAGGNTSVMSDAASIAFGDATVTAPVGLSYGFAETGTGVELTWSETDSSRVKQVIVYRVEKGGTTPLKLTTTEQNSYTDLTAAKGKAYYYYLVAVGPTGTESEKGKAVYVEIE